MKKHIIGLCALSLLAACSGPAIKDTALIQQTALSQAQIGEQKPQETIDKSREIQINAQQQDLYFYSPNYMGQAEKEMTKAEEAFKLNKPANIIITHSLTAQALFERGLSTKNIVINQLKPSFDGLDMLKKINSHILAKGDFNDIEDDIKDLILLIEQGKTNEAIKDQQDVLSDITQLEIETLKIAHFNPAENALEKAEDADAEEFATKTFEIAEKAVEQLELLIERKYKDRDLISNQSKTTIRLAQHAENVAKTSKPLLKLNPEKAEQHILYVESLLARVSMALKHDAVNHMPLDNQSMALAQAAERLNKQAQTNINNSQWSQEKKQLETTIAELKQQLQDKTVSTEINNTDETVTTAAQSSNDSSETTLPATTPIVAIEPKPMTEPLDINKPVAPILNTEPTPTAQTEEPVINDAAISENIIQEKNDIKTNDVNSPATSTDSNNESITEESTTKTVDTIAEAPVDKAAAIIETQKSVEQTTTETTEP